jgi:hypothetical protein
MLHAEALALLEAATLVPGRLREVTAPDAEEGSDLREHLAACDICRAEARAWQAVDEALAAATPGSVTAPAGARDRVMAAVRRTGVARGPGSVLGAPRPAPAPGDSAPRSAPAPGGAPASTVAPGPPRAGEPGPATGRDLTAPAAPGEGRVWRRRGERPPAGPASPAGPGSFGEAPGSGGGPTASIPLPGPGPVASSGHASAAGPVEGTPAVAPATGRRRLRALPGGSGTEGVGLRAFLALAAAAIVVFVAGAALGGPLGLVGQQETGTGAGRAELEKVLGRMSDVLQEPGTAWAPLVDQAGEPAGAVVLGTGDETGRRTLGVVTRSLGPLAEGEAYVCLIEREGVRYEVGTMRFAGDPDAPGDVAYWVGPLGDDLPVDVGIAGDEFLVYREGDTGGEPLLSTVF